MGWRVPLTPPSSAEREETAASAAAAGPSGTARRGLDGEWHRDQQRWGLRWGFWSERVLQRGDAASVSPSQAIRGGESGRWARPASSTSLIRPMVSAAATDPGSTTLFGRGNRGI